MDYKQEQEYWRKFCTTGMVGDYLAYRQLVNQRRPAPATVQQKDSSTYADYNGSHSNTRTEYS